MKSGLHMPLSEIELFAPFKNVRDLENLENINHIALIKIKKK